MERSFLYIFLSLAVSLLICFYQIWWIFFIILLLLLVLIVFTSYSRLAYYTIIFLLTGVILGSFSFWQTPVFLPSNEEFIIEGNVNNYPQFENDRTKFILDTDHANLYLKKIQVFMAFDSSLQRGERIVIKGSLKPPNPPGNPGQFNYPAYLEKEGIFYTLSVASPEDIKSIAPAKGLHKMTNGFRERGETTVNKTLPQQEAAILLGMLLGKKDAIDDSQYSDFQKTGIVHIFAVSGLHVGFLLLFCTVITSLLRVTRRVKLIFCLLAIFLYGTLVGWPVSVVRASIMAVISLIAYYTGRQNQMLNSLGLAGIIILFLDPRALFKISFQLSFLATFGLVFVFPLLRKKIKYKGFFWDLILIPISAQLTVLPMVAYHFNLFTPAAIISNIFITYLAGTSVILGFLALISAQVIPGLAVVFLYPAGFFIEIILQLITVIKNIPWSYIWVATPGVTGMIIYYCGLILSLHAIKGLLKKHNLYVGLTMVMFFLTVLCLPANIYNRGTMEMVFIDVGQGDSTLIKTPKGKFILIDGGGSHFYDVASTRLLPYLHHRGIRKLFLVISSHPDTDHLLGLEKTLEELKVEHIALPKSISHVEEYHSIKELASQQESNVITLHTGHNVNIEKDFSINVLHPEPLQQTGTDYNDESLVLLIRNGDWSVLLTGDLNREQLDDLAAKSLPSPIKIVKVPHHGSRFSLSEKFYQHISPEFAVICVGNNNFGHPHNDVLSFLEKHNIRVLRTDVQGNIYFDSSGKLETFR